MNQLMQQVLWQSLSRDPRVHQFINEAKSKNITLEELFREQAKAKGVDVDEFLSKNNLR